jgi:iron(III) transport system permease protein
VSEAGRLAGGPSLAGGGVGEWLRLKRGRLDFGAVVALIAIAVLLFLVVSPFVHLILKSLEGSDGALTLGNYAKAYGRERYLIALWNSVQLGLWSAALCSLYAVPMAWAVARTDTPFKPLINVVVLAAFVTPPYTGAISWILLAGPNSGWLNRAFMWVTGAEAGPLNIFSFPGLVLVISLYSFPYIYIFTLAALEMVSSEMEDAANILGAGTMRTTLRVTIPLVIPAILGGMIITFLEAIALFGSPAIIAIPARFNVVTTQLYQFFSNPIRDEVAAAYAMPLLLITVLLFGAQRLIIRRKGFVSLTGKGGERRLIRLGRWRWATFGYAMFIGSLSVFLPYIFLTQAAFAKSWGLGFSFENLTLFNFHYILVEHQMARVSLFNSFFFGGAAAFFAIALTLFIAYIVHRKLVPFGGVLAFLCVAPFVIPGIVLAIGFYAAYAPPPLALYGTSLLLILAFTTRFLPIAYVNSSAAMRSINPEMEEAVRILGGGRLTAIRRVVAPLMKRGLVGAWLLVFIPATRELSSSLFLYGPSTRTVAIMIFDLSEEGNFEHVAALGLMLQLLTIPLLWIGFKVVGRDFMLRRGT